MIPRPRRGRSGLRPRRVRQAAPYQTGSSSAPPGAGTGSSSGVGVLPVSSASFGARQSSGCASSAPQTGTVRVHGLFRAGCFADAWGNIFSPSLVIRERCCGDQGQAQSKRGKQAKKSSFHCDPSMMKEFGLLQGDTPLPKFVFPSGPQSLFPPAGRSFG